MFVFFIRLPLSLLASITVCRIFFENASWLRIAILALVLLGFSYLFEHLRRDDSQDGNP